MSLSGWWRRYWGCKRGVGRNDGEKDRASFARRWREQHTVSLSVIGMVPEEHLNGPGVGKGHDMLVVVSFIGTARPPFVILVCHLGEVIAQSFSVFNANRP